MSNLNDWCVTSGLPPNIDLTEVKGRGIDRDATAVGKHTAWFPTMKSRCVHETFAQAA
jgi:hypothetical protein